MKESQIGAKARLSGISSKSSSTFPSEAEDDFISCASASSHSSSSPEDQPSGRRPFLTVLEDEGKTVTSPGTSFSSAQDEAPVPRLQRRFVHKNPGGKSPDFSEIEVVGESERSSTAERQKSPGWVLSPLDKDPSLSPSRKATAGAQLFDSPGNVPDFPRRLPDAYPKRRTENPSLQVGDQSEVTDQGGGVGRERSRHIAEGVSGAAYSYAHSEANGHALDRLGGLSTPASSVTSSARRGKHLRMPSDGGSSVSSSTTSTTISGSRQPAHSREGKSEIHANAYKIYSMSEVGGGVSVGPKKVRHDGAIWILRFSLDLTMLATGGMCGKVMLWQVLSADGVQPYLNEEPAHVFEGHEGEVLDLSWSVDLLLASCGTDCCVRLWHPSSSSGCLRVFQHPQIATGVVFHPYFQELLFTGCLDGFVRVFDLRGHSNQSPHAAVCEVDTKGFVTSLALSNDGGTVVAGLFEGKCMFIDFVADKVKFQGKVVMPIKSTRGRNAKGHKVTGLQYWGDGRKADRERHANLLISTLDSRVRLYRVHDVSVLCKYKGHLNRGCMEDNSEVVSTQIRSVMTQDGCFIATGSEDGHLCLWTRAPPRSRGIFSAARRKDRNDNPTRLDMRGGGAARRSNLPVNTPTSVAFWERGVHGEAGQERTLEAGRMPLYVVVGMYTGDLRIVKAVTGISSRHALEG